MGYDLGQLDPIAFQDLAAALALQTFGAGVQVMGSGRDGGRDLYHKGPLVWMTTADDSPSEIWDGYTVFQVKHKERLSTDPKDDATWLWGQIRDELERWADPTSGRDPVPDYLVFITNVRLSPMPQSGGHDRLNDNIRGYIDGLADSSRDVDGDAERRVKLARISRLKKWRFWDEKQIQTLLHLWPTVRRAFPGFLTAADVFSDLADFTHTLPLEQLEPGLHANPRTRSLDAYLTAAARAADEHPYPGVLHGITPPLAEVYLRQSVITLGDSTLSTAAEEVLGRDRACIVVAGPGGGKSSLLRRYTADRIESWRAGQAVDVVPVIVRATALIGRPLAEALAQAVTADLSEFGLVEALSPAFFRDPPDHDLRWLVLVDGLDEITNPRAREQVLKAVAAMVADKRSTQYRFAITTRPLPHHELAVLNANVPRYELLPFTPDDLPQVVRAWFSRLCLSDPEESTTRFLTALDRAHLAELARTPLLTAMLCQLHAANPGHPLPASRGRLYRDFTELLLRHQQKAGVRDQVRRALGFYGEQALASAESTLDHLPDLMEHLAAAWYGASNLRTAVDIVAKHPAAAIPRGVPESEWREFLDAILRSSGLLTTQDGELVFLHQTIQEYLAARHATCNGERRAATLASLFNNAHRRGGLFSGATGLRCSWGGPYWRPPRAEPSFVGFVLDSVGDDPAALWALQRLVALGGLAGSAFIIDQIQLGTAIPPQAAAAAIDALAGLADRAADPAVRLAAAKCWATVAGGRSIDVIASLAVTRDIHTRLRFEAARYLDNLGDPRATDLLAELATKDQGGWSDGDRLDCVSALAKRGDPRAADLYASLAEDANLTELRVRAAVQLGSLDHQRAADLLARFAADLEPANRLDAALQLVNLRDPRALDLLHSALKANRNWHAHASGQWMRGVQQLAQQGDSRVDQLCRDLADDDSVPVHARLMALEGLVELDVPDAANLCVKFVRAHAPDDAASSVRQCWLKAIDMLADMGDPRAADLYDELGQDVGSPSDARLTAAASLARLGDPRGVVVLMALADDDTQSAILRLRAATIAVERGQSGAFDLLHRLARSELSTYDTPFIVIFDAAEALAKVGDARSGDLLHALARDHAHYALYRQKASEALCELGDPRSSEILRNLAEDSKLDGIDRLRAARALWETGDPHGAELYEALRRNTYLRRRERIKNYFSDLRDRFSIIDTGMGSVIEVPMSDFEALARLPLDALRRVTPSDALRGLEEPPALWIADIF